MRKRPDERACRVFEHRGHRRARETYALENPLVHHEQKRAIIEAIVEKIIIGKDEITLNFCYLPSCKIWQMGGGRGGIRTPGWVAPSPDFESGTLNHSATLPAGTNE